MARLSASTPVKPQDESDTTGSRDDDPDSQEGGLREEPGGLLDYFASHPSTSDRIEQATRYSECFRRGETRCDVE